MCPLLYSDKGERAAADWAKGHQRGGGGHGRQAILQTTVGGNRAWMGCPLSQGLEPEILHLTYNSEEGRDGVGEGLC